MARFPRLSRAELAATVCEWLDWQRPNGGLKTREYRDLPEALVAREVLQLPALRTGRPRGAATTVPQTAQGDAQLPVTGPLHSLQPIRLRRVEQPAEHFMARADGPPSRQIGSMSASPPAEATKTANIAATAPRPSAFSSIRSAPTPGRLWRQSHNENCWMTSEQQLQQARMNWGVDALQIENARRRKDWSGSSRSAVRTS